MAFYNWNRTAIVTANAESLRGARRLWVFFDSRSIINDGDDGGRAHVDHSEGRSGGTGTHGSRNADAGNGCGRDGRANRRNTADRKSAARRIRTDSGSRNHSNRFRRSTGPCRCSS